MMDSSDNDGPRRPGPRPFVSGRPIVRVEPVTMTSGLSRPFSLTGARTQTAAGITTTKTAIDMPGREPTPRWTVAVYEPGLERHVPAVDDRKPAFEMPRRMDSGVEDVVEASLALAEDVVEAQRHASSATAADMLENVARRLRRGEILLLPGASTRDESAVVSSVLAALLGGRR